MKKNNLGNLIDWVLEDRVVPASYVWSPQGMSVDWHDGNNWVLQGTTTRGTAPGQNDKAVLDSGTRNAVLSQDVLIKDLDLQNSYLGSIKLSNDELKVKSGTATIAGSIVLDDAGAELIFESSTVTLQGANFTGQSLNWIKFTDGTTVTVSGNVASICNVTLMVGDTGDTLTSTLKIAGNVAKLSLESHGDLDLRPKGKLELFGEGQLGGINSSIVANDDNTNTIFNEGTIHRKGAAANADNRVNVEIPIDQQGTLVIESGTLSIGHPDNLGQGYGIRQQGANAVTEIHGGTKLILIRELDIQGGKFKTKHGGVIDVVGDARLNGGTIHLGADSNGDHTKFVTLSVDGDFYADNNGDIIFNVTYDTNTSLQYSDVLDVTGSVNISPMGILRVVNHASNPSNIQDLDLIFSDNIFYDFDFKYLGETGWTDLDTVFASAVVWDAAQQKYVFRLN